MKRLHTAGILSALATLSGVLLSPAIANLVPAKAAAALSITGLVLQAFTKPVTAGGSELVPKDPAPSGKDATS